MSEKGAAAPPLMPESVHIVNLVHMGVSWGLHVEPSKGIQVGRARDMAKVTQQHTRARHAGAAAARATRVRDGPLAPGFGQRAGVRTAAECARTEVLVFHGSLGLLASLQTLWAIWATFLLASNDCSPCFFFQAKVCVRKAWCGRLGTEAHHHNAQRNGAREWRALLAGAHVCPFPRCMRKPATMERRHRPDVRQDHRGFEDCATRGRVEGFARRCAHADLPPDRCPDARRYHPGAQLRSRVHLWALSPSCVSREFAGCAPGRGSGAVPTYGSTIPDALHDNVGVLNPGDANTHHAPVLLAYTITPRTLACTRTRNTRLACTCAHAARRKAPERQRRRPALRAGQRRAPTSPAYPLPRRCIRRRRGSAASGAAPHSPLSHVLALEADAGAGASCSPLHWQDMDTDVDADADAYSEGEAEGDRELDADGEEEVDDWDSEYEDNGSDSRPVFVPPGAQRRECSAQQELARRYAPYVYSPSLSGSGSSAGYGLGYDDPAKCVSSHAQLCNFRGVSEVDLDLENTSGSRQPL
ncbi:hypothetical protein GGX14DRAFT_560040 [Mycena pura]|uniref:Uncharacterized protein n=1 Tax=Mycena pura TaxID=153505 RepID=A0AAD6YHD1_9AGAR|nr:hypothetical protein GGX14DRAFT_560040 [Mycena pura]